MANYVVRFQVKENPTSRVICIPYAGATAAYYRPWAALFPPDVELCAIEIPGRFYLKDTPATNMNAIIDTIFPQIIPFLDKPFAIFGHSFGTIVSYELVKRIMKENKKLPVGLFVSQRRAPQLPSRFRATAHLLDQEFIDEMQNLYDAIPKEVLKEKELLKLLLPALKIDIGINETYLGTLDPLLDIPVWGYYAKGDKTITLEEMEQWKAVTRNEFKLQVFEGEHFFIDKEKAKIIDDIAKILK